MKAAALLLIILHPFIFLQGYMAGNWYSFFHDYSLGMFFGVFSYCYMVTSLLLATRIPIFDWIFGQDKVIRIHSHLASTAIILGLVHYLLKKSYIFGISLQSSMGGTALILATVIATVTVIFMVGKFMIPLPGITALYRFGKKFSLMDYDKLKKFHNLFSLVVVFLIIHVLLATSTQESNLRMIMMGTYGAIGIARYCYFIIRRKVGRRHYHLTAINHLNSSTFELHLTPHKRELNFKPGQFCYIRIQSSGIKRKEHPFTISSSPAEDLLTFTIKELGDFTQKLSTIHPDVPVTVDGPYGKFTPIPNEHSYLFAAAGIGITPFLSILKQWQHESITTPVTLIWSATHESELIALDLLQRMESNYPWFELQIFVTRESDTTFNKGRVTETDLLQQYREREIYLCGPTPFMNSITAKMKEYGVKRSQIHSESFSS